MSHWKAYPFSWGWRLGCGLMIWGASTEPGWSTPESGSALLDEVVVTARKIPEKAWALPQQVRVLSQETIQDRRIKGIEEIQRESPSLHYINTGNGVETPVFIRGLVSFGNNEPSVGFFQDGFYQGTDSMLGFPLFDVERIEILKGPQTTLFGKNATAGVIQVLSREPTDQMEAEVEVGLGDPDRQRLDVSLSGPVKSDALLVRLAGYAEETGGEYASLTNGEAVDRDRSEGFRLSLLAFPDDAWSVKPMLTYRERNQRGYSYRKVSGPSDWDGRPYDRNDPNDILVTSLNAALEVEGALDAGTFTSLTGYNWNDEAYGADADYGPASTYFLERDVRRTEFSQEFRMYGGDDELAWLGGVYYYLQRDDFDHRIHTGGKYGAIAAQTDTFTEKTTWSGFGQVEWEALQSLKVTPGLRYDFDQRKQTGNGLTEREKKELNLSPRLTLSYAWSPSWNAYFSGAMGHRAGGFNDGDFDDFNEERSRNVELGVKGRPGKGWELKAALFKTWLKDQQLFEMDPVTSTEITINKGRAEIQGVEMEGAGPLRGGWRVRAAWTLLDARYTDYTATRAGPDGTKSYVLTGNRLQHVPHYQATAGLEYQKDLKPMEGRSSSFQGILSMHAMGRKAWDDFNASQQEAYQVADLDLIWRLGDWRIHGYVDNMFNEKYFTNYVNQFTYNLAGSALAIRGPGQTLGVTISVVY